MLGGLTVTVGGRRYTRFRTHKTASLLAFLAYHPKTSHSREFLIDLIWPESDSRQGRQSLSTSLSSLRRQLEHPGTELGSVLQADRTCASLRQDAFETDVLAFEAAARRAQMESDKGDRLTFLKQAIDEYIGPLLPGFDEDWVLLERERLHEEYCAALVAAAEAYEAFGQLDAARSFARKAVAVEPLFDHHHELLARLGSVARRLTSAVAADRVREANGTHSPQADSRIDMRSERSVPVRLPSSHSRFFGREAEIASLITELRASEGSILTIIGPGGIGKTRLALEAARRASEALRPCFVPLADLRDPSAIPAAIAEALGVPISVSTSVRHLAEALTTHCGLLILDNFEHLTDGIADVERLAESAQGVRFLATSRQPTGAARERQFLLGPLETPELLEDLGDLAQCPSAALFIDRAQQAVPDFQVTPRNMEAIQSLCAGLEGIPLAIELAAARSQVMTPSQMCSQLEQRFEFLVNRKRPTSERHRTMAAALQWSYDLLPEELQRFYASLSVFRGGWTLESAQSVLAEPLSSEHLEDLIEASLVQRKSSDVVVRFGMLETIRVFAASQVDATTEVELRARHVAHFLELVERGAAQLSGPARTEWLERLKPEQDNIYKALEHAFEHDPLVGLRLAIAASSYWEVSANNQVSRRWIDAFLSLPFEYPPELRSAALTASGTLHGYVGNFRHAKQVLLESLEIARNLRRPDLAAGALIPLCFTLSNMRDPDVQIYLKEGRETTRQLGAPPLEAIMQLPISMELAYSGFFEEATEECQVGLEIATRLGDPYLIERMRTSMGSCQLFAGNDDAAEPHYRAAIEMAVPLGDLMIVGICHWGLCAVALHRNQLDIAWEEWRHHYETLKKSAVVWGYPILLETASAARIQEGRTMEGAVLFAAAESLRKKFGTPHPHSSYCYLKELFDALPDLRSDPNLTHAWKRGAEMSWEVAAEFALSGSESDICGKPGIRSFF